MKCPECKINNVGKDKKYCSRECWIKSKHTKKIVVCVNCNKEFEKHPSQIKKTNNNFCSKSCAAKYNNKKYPKRHVEYNNRCSICNKSIQRKGRCDKHKRSKSKNRSGANGQKWKYRPLKFKLGNNLRCRVNAAIKNKAKAGSAVRDLGCSIGYLIKYLENKFEPGMTWDNWSRDGWHIDHIIPLTHFDLTDREDFLKACHYTNLQPMWAEDNMKKGSKII